MKEHIHIDGHSTIEVEHDGKTGTVTSHLKAAEVKSVHDVAWDFGVDIFESFILALACTGYRVDTGRMRGVVDTVMDAMTNHADEIDFDPVLPEMFQHDAAEAKKLIEDLRHENTELSRKLGEKVAEVESHIRNARTVLAYLVGDLGNE